MMNRNGSAVVHCVFASIVVSLGLLAIGTSIAAAAPDPRVPAVDRITRLPEDVQQGVHDQAQGNVAAGTSFGQNCVGGGPPPCDETTRSLGGFRLRIVGDKFGNYFQGCPGWQTTICPPPNNLTDRRLEVHHLIDNSTLIGRSAPITHGNPLDTLGVPVGSSLFPVKDADFTMIPTGFQGPPATPEIHTEVVSMCLSSGSCLPVDLVNVKAGFAATGRHSIGEVERMGASPPDFPAESFFDVYVNVEIKPCGSLPAPIVLENPTTNPMLVEADNVTDLPPQVVYIHGGSQAVPVYTKFAAPPFWGIGELVGYLVLAGHGVGEQQDPTAALCASTELNLPKIGACCLPAFSCVPDVTDAQCHDDLGGHFLGDGSTCPAGSCNLVGACCLPNNQCQLTVSQDECIKLGGRYEGDGSTTCAHNAAGDCIPTVSEWGLVVMAMLVLTAATVVIMRRRAMVRGGSYTR